jgi:hypothetical protein
MKVLTYPIIEINMVVQNIQRMIDAQDIGLDIQANVYYELIVKHPHQEQKVVLEKGDLMRLHKLLGKCLKVVEGK